MRRRVTLVIAFCCVSASVVVAQKFWATKSSAEWTDEELKKITTDSPWAKNRTIAVGPSGDAGRPLSGRGSGTGGGMGRGTGGGGGPRSGRTPTAKIVMLWQSALPMKQASVRSGMKVPSHPITLPDKTAEVDAHLGMIGVKMKFNLKDMQFGGKLEL